jgi:hypothetical protein
MAATCTIEVGLFKKKPCGQPAASACANCEQPLCAQHVFPELNDAGKKTGKFVCKDCGEAAKAYLKNQAAAAAPASKPAATPPAPKPTTAPPAAPGKPALAQPKKEEQKPEKEKEEKKDDLGAIEFTPTRKEE